MEITCKIEWIHEDEGLDEGIQRRIIDRVVEKISKEALDQLMEKISAQMAERVDEMINSILEKFMSKEIMVTDNWGDIQEKYESVNELLKAKFDDYMTVGVDLNGRPVKGRSCGGKPRIEYVLDRKISEALVSMENLITREVDKKLKIMKEEATKEAAVKIVEKMNL